jgi:hemerythrin-like domain-containing protein
METSGNSEARRGLWREFEPEAVSHAAAEEEVFYAALIAIPEAQEQARHSVSEHEEAASLIEELGETDMSSGAWIQKFEKLKNALEHHMEEEEKKVFSLARKLLSDGSARKMTSTFEARKRAERSAA